MRSAGFHPACPSPGSFRLGDRELPHALLDVEGDGLALPVRGVGRDRARLRRRFVVGWRRRIVGGDRVVLVRGDFLRGPVVDSDQLIGIVRERAGREAIQLLHDGRIERRQLDADAAAGILGADIDRLGGEA